MDVFANYLQKQNHKLDILKVTAPASVPYWGTGGKVSPDVSHRGPAQKSPEMR